MNTTDQAWFEAGLQTAVDLANAAASRLDANDRETPRYVDGAAHLRAYAAAVQALLDARDDDPVGYTVRTITEGS